ncbi:Mismatch repair protein msh3 [Venturia effusa]|uniref:MutS protein homolog 3 n=1 Tax=Venturia effusa TaxID=50376 RepID=A0A517KVM4_9PEZI|nr:Mismatch repair protein msh3 [Venturia effusa]
MTLSKTGPSIPTSSQAKKQQSISSFFTPKSTGVALPKPSPPSVSEPASSAPLFVKPNENDPDPQTFMSNGTKRLLQTENSDLENRCRNPKRTRRAPDTDNTPLQRMNAEPQSLGAGPPSSKRTSKYLFSSSPLLTDDVAQGQPDFEQRRKATLHQQFVQKLGRPDSIAELRRKDQVLSEDVSVEVEEDEEQNEEEPPLKKITNMKRGGARANGKLTPMEQQYLDIKRKHLDTVILYEVGYKFRFFGEDARTAAKVLSIVCIPGKLRYDEHPSEAHYSKFASASFPIARLHVHVKRLVSAGHKVGIVRQVETAALKAAGDNRNGPFVRKLTNVYTRGTYVDDPEGLVGPVAAPAGAPATGYLLCLTESNARGWGNDEKVHVGILAVQPATGSILYDDFEDGFMRSEIETRLLHIAPCEYLIVGELSTATEKLIKHLSGSKSNVFGDQARVERVEKSKTMAAQAYSHISGFYAGKMQSKASTSVGQQSSLTLDKVHQLSEHVTIGLSAMITHLTEYGLEHIFDLTKNFQPFSASTHMLLNGNTLSSLEIYTNQTDTTEKGSLFWTLDRTQTRFGKRLLRNWVGRPLLDKLKLEERTSAVEELLDSDRTRHVERIKKVFSLVKTDLEKVLVRIYYGKASRPELLGFLQILQRVANEFHYVKEPGDAGFRSSLLNDAIALLPRTGEAIVEFLDRINMQAAKDDDKYSFFRDEHETDDITNQKLGIAAVEHELNEHRAIAASTLGKKKVDYAAVAGIEFLIEVENSPTSNLKKVPASWVVINKTKKVSRFHTPEVVKMIRERDQYKEALAAACDKAFTALLHEISGLHQPLRDCIQAMALLDCLLSLAEVASQPGYCKPTFTSSTQIHVIGGRHPMVEQLLLDAYVPNNTSLSNQARFDSIDPSALLITGPNMGGKSSYVRSVALVSIMGQIGSYVPAESAELGLLDAVFTRMGAFDNMMRGESTFMVELGETSDILKQATPRSLIILDELGRGTSTHDGVAIAEAVLRELVDRGVMTLFITHYQQLARLEHTLGAQGLKNVHMRFFEEGGEKVTFLYEVAEGVAHRSYGLNVAGLARVPVSVLDKAGVKSKEMEQYTERRRIESMSHMLDRFMRGADETEQAESLDSLVGALEQL